MSPPVQSCIDLTAPIRSSAHYAGSYPTLSAPSRKEQRGNYGPPWERWRPVRLEPMAGLCKA